VTEDDFEMPDLEGLAEQMEDALAEAQKAMADLPTDMGDLGGLMGSLSSLVGGLPADLGELSGAISGFEAQHEANVASARGEPDWGVEADIRAGTKLHVVIGTEMDLAAAAALRLRSARPPAEGPAGANPATTRAVASAPSPRTD